MGGDLTEAGVVVGRAGQPGAGGRNHLIDTARFVSVLVVVIFHSTVYRYQLVEGQLVHGSWQAGPVWRAFSWVFMVMPVFFIAAGYGDAVSVDKMRAGRLPVARFLANRGRRLSGPLALYITVSTVVATTAAWIGWLEPATTLSTGYADLLWFIVVYLLLVLTAPASVRWHDRLGGWLLVAILAASLAVDQIAVRPGYQGVGVLNMFLVWPFSHQLGIAYHRGWFRRGPMWVPLACLAGASAAIVVMVWMLGYPEAAVAIWGPGNNVPPTAALGLLGLAQVSVLGLLERAGVLRRVTPRFRHRLALANLTLFTVYLWQKLGFIVAVATLFGISLLVPQIALVALSQMVVAGVSLTIIAALVPPVGWLERALVPRLGRKQSLSRAISSYLMLTVGLTLVGLNGLVIHPARPWSSLGVALVWGGCWQMARAADRLTKVPAGAGSTPAA